MLSLGEFDFDPAGDPRVVISNESTADGVVIADAVVFSAVGVAKSRTETTKAVRAKSPDSEPTEELARLTKTVEQLKQRLSSLEKSAPPKTIAMATGDDADAGDIHLAIRGVVHNQGPLVPRGVLRVASASPFPEIPEGESGRRELAAWIASEENPLTARVMANRVWHWLMGRGIVPSVDNFGSMGDAPSHPELLDHLATSLIDGGWSVKTLIRQIMLSRTYQLSTQGSEIAGGVDPGNRLLWRMNRKRLRAEDIRDSLLFVSGKLELTLGGPNLSAATKSEYGYRFRSHRRSVYVPVFRNTLPEVFEVFDFADPNIQGGRRNSSTIASQALWLMNHPFVSDRSREAALKLIGRGESETIERVGYVYRQVIGRAPSPEELSVAVEFVDSSGDGESTVDRWAVLYQTLFQCIDFRYLN